MQDFTISYANAQDAPAILALAHKAFSVNEPQIDFPSLLPKLYGKTADSTAKHLVLRAEGKICALLCLEMMTVQVGDCSCKFGYIGTVSVDADYRGRGYMQALLHAAEREMRCAGCAFGALGGRRQRYEYFGYEPAGCTWLFTLTKDNVRHACADAATDLHIAPLTQNAAWISGAKALHDAMPIHCTRDENAFPAILSSWSAQAFAVLRGEKFMGYCSISFANARVCVQEMALADDADLPAFCVALFSYLKCEHCTIVLPSVCGAAQQFFARICDTVSLSTNRSFAIYDWCATLQPFLQLRCDAGDVPNGNVCVAIQDAPSPVVLRFCVKHGCGTVTAMPQDTPADLTLSSLDATALFFAPYSAFTSNSAKLPAALFPLPLFIPNADCI
ncbi:MAG: GNAT family N-acetyltransferase [Ruthenibacterium sp.]